MTDRRPADDELADALRRRLAAAVRDEEPPGRLRATVIGAASNEADAAGCSAGHPLLRTSADASKNPQLEPYGSTSLRSSSRDASPGRTVRAHRGDSVVWRSPVRIVALLLPLVLAGSVFLAYGGDDGEVSAHDDGRAPTGDGAAPVSTDISPQFLDILAPVSGDGAARATERSNLALTRAASGPKAECMTQAGFPRYKDIGLMATADFWSGHSFFLSPTKLEHRGFVSVADARLDAIPAEARVAWAECSGEVDGIKAAAAEVDAFIVYRDSDANPIPNWEQGVVAVEMDKIARSDDARYEEYRECFRRLGFSAEVARDPTEAAQQSHSTQNEALAGPIDPVVEQRWREGQGVLDADGGALARRVAVCWRLFEEHLTPVLEKKRDEMIVGKREALLEGQELLFEAIGGIEAMARESTNW